jgi:hypothetical protein
MPRLRISVVITLCAVLGCAVVSQAAVSDTRPFRLIHRGGITLPSTARDRNGNDVEITGLSGITWLGHDRYAAIMDNSDKLLAFSLSLSRDGTPLEASDFEVVTLAERHDYEDVAACPEPLQQRIAALRIKQGFPDPGRCLLVAEEDTPAIRAVSLTDGSLLGVIPTPEEFATRRPNRGLESLDVEADGRHIWTANEEALTADGPAAGGDAGTVVRIARIEIPEPGNQSAEEPLQIAYAVDPPHHFIPVFFGEPLSGVTAITVLSLGQLLVLERSGCPGLPPFENRMYLVDTQGVADVSGIDRELAIQTEVHSPKVLLWKDQLGCNIEGLCLGPRLRGGGRAVVAVADNGGLGTPNQVIGFAMEDESSATQLPMLLGGMAIVAVVLGFVTYRLTR